MERNRSETNLPLLTICMPVKNRAWCINRVLNAIENIEYPKEKVKIVFVDDYSNDGTYEIISEWVNKALKIGFNKVEVIRARTNIPQARNICISRVEGKYLLFWDSDVIPPSGLLREIVETLEHKSDIGIIGADYIYEQSTGIRYRPTINKETHAVYMGFTLIRREVFEKVGGFNEKLSVGEDTEFCIRVKEKTHYKILWSSKPVLHLKRPQIDKTSLSGWIRYNFYVRSKEYYYSWQSLPNYLRFRVIYWILWPLALGFLIYALTLNQLLLVLITSLFIISSATPVIKQKGLIYGIESWIKGNVITGITLSYGVLREFLIHKVKLSDPNKN